MGREWRIKTKGTKNELAVGAAHARRWVAEAAVQRGRTWVLPGSSVHFFFLADGFLRTRTEAGVTCTGMGVRPRCSVQERGAGWHMAPLSSLSRRNSQLVH